MTQHTKDLCMLNLLHQKWDFEKAYGKKIQEIGWKPVSYLDQQQLDKMATTINGYRIALEELQAM